MTFFYWLPHNRMFLSLNVDHLAPHGQSNLPRNPVVVIVHIEEAEAAVVAIAIFQCVQQFWLYYFTVL